MSWAARKFVADARARRQTIDVKPEQLELVSDRQEIQFIDDPSRKLKVTEVVAFSTAPIIGRGAVPYDTTWERLAFASHAAEIELDTLTGSVKVLKYVAAHDVGRALNPFAVSQQIEGGVIMGIGAALTESMLTDNGTGVPLNPNLLDYRALSILDVPKTIDVIMVERPKQYGVYGAHGIGEPPIALAGSVISNAIYNAVGVWMTDLPMNRARTLAALRSAVMKSFEAYEPQSIQEGVSLLSQFGARGKVLAGGSDLVGGIMKDWVQGKGRPLPEKLVDITTIPELRGISVDGGALTIGAATTPSEVIESAEVRSGWSLLSEAATSVASPLIRNFATLGGNINQRPRCWFFRGENFNCYKKGGDFCFAVTGDNTYHAIIGGELCYIVHPSDTSTALLALNASARGWPRRV